MHALRHDPYTPADNTLSVVVNDTETTLTQRQAPVRIPDFEGKKVDLSAGKVTSVKALDLDGTVFSMDEIVKVVVEARVSGIHHDVDETTGRLVRVHRLKALDAVVVEWDFDIDTLRGRG